MSMQSKIIGLMTIWGTDLFAAGALRQALKHCDEVIISCSAHSETMLKFADHTEDILASFSSPKIKWADNKPYGRHDSVKCSILNGMLEKSDYFQPNNWIWILDGDEFYSEDWIEHFKSGIASSNVDRVEVLTNMYFATAKHYLRGSHYRFFKIKSSSQRFSPTQNWPDVRFSICPPEPVMHHYSLLRNPRMREAFWAMEFGNKNDPRITWLKEIYKKCDLDNQHETIERNKKLFGVNGLWHDSCFWGRNDGTLFEVTSPPPFIGDVFASDLDFRKFWNYAV